MRTKLSLAVSLALLSAGVLSGCSDDSAPTATDTQQEAPKTLSASLLKYIPADSPYFVATRESMPEQDAFALYQRMQPKNSLEADLDELRDTLHEIDDEVLHSLISLLIAMGEEFVGVETLDDIHALGFKMSPRSLYTDWVSCPLCVWNCRMRTLSAKHCSAFSPMQISTQVRPQQTGMSIGY